MLKSSRHTDQRLFELDHSDELIVQEAVLDELEMDFEVVIVGDFAVEYRLGADSIVPPGDPASDHRLNLDQLEQIHLSLHNSWLLLDSESVLVV